MTEPSSNPAQSPVPPPAPPSPPYQASPPYQPGPPPPAVETPSPVPAATPPAQPAEAPPPPPANPPGTQPSYPPGSVPAYPPATAPGYPAGFPGQPAAYPVSAMPASAMPASAMPMSGYPAVYMAPAPRVSPWIWVLAAVSFVLLLAASGLGATYLGAQNRIAELEQTVAEVEEERDELRLDLEDAQVCVDAFDDWWAAPVGQDEDEWSALLRACR